jgi:hypothetical protein
MNISDKFLEDSSFEESFGANETGINKEIALCQLRAYLRFS